MIFESDIDHYGRRSSNSVNPEAQTDVRRLADVLKKLAQLAEDLETRVRWLEN